MSANALLAGFVRPAFMSAYPYSNSAFICSSDKALMSIGLADGIFTSKGSPL